MEPLTTTAPTRSTDRLLQALSTLAALLDRTINEVKSLDSDFQSRLLQAVHDTEASLQQQASEHLQRALEEADQRIRAQVVEEMKAHFEQEMTSAVESVRKELQAEKEEREKLSREVDRATQAAVQWEGEHARLIAECDRANQAVSEARAAQEQAAARAQAQAQVAATAAAQPKPVPSGGAASTEAVHAESARVEGLVKAISELIDNPATELSTVIRKNVERAELESYLKGIRFAVNGK